MNDLKLKFYKSSPNRLNLDTTEEVILIGKSNAGKSSFINNLGNNKNLAHTSQTPGKTILLNYYKIENSNSYFVDTPGYGYNAKSKLKTQEFDKMMHDLLTNDTFKIKLVFWIYDIRREFDNNDLNIINFLMRNDILKNMYLVLTKIDKESNNFINQKIKYFQKELNFGEEKIFYISNSHKTNIDKVQKFIKNQLKLNFKVDS